MVFQHGRSAEEVGTKTVDSSIRGDIHGPAVLDFAFGLLLCWLVFILILAMLLLLVVMVVKFSISQTINMFLQK